MKIRYNNELYIEGEPGDEFIFSDGIGEHKLQVQSTEAGCNQCYFKGLDVCGFILCEGLTYVEINAEESLQKTVVRKRKHR